MKNTIYIFILCFFAFAKMSFAAVPTAEKSLGIEHPKDSLLLFTVESKNQEDAEKEIDRLLKDSRKLANAAFWCIAVFLLGILAAILEAQFLAIGAPFLGLILSVASIVKLTKVRRLLDYFPALEADKERMNRFTFSITRATIAAVLFSLGSLIMAGFVSTDGEFLTSSLPPVARTAGLGFILFCLFDALNFKTKNKVKK
jgi:hypothetical protein